MGGTRLIEDHATLMGGFDVIHSLVGSNEKLVQRLTILAVNCVADANPDAGSSLRSNVDTKL